MAAQPAPAAADDVFVFTREHLEAMPDDGNRYELLDGKILVTPMPARPHEHVVTELVYLLRQHVGRPGLVFASGIEFVVSDRTVLVPDVTVFAEDGPDPVEEAPERRADLVVEVSSPSTKRRDAMLKRPVYLDHVAEYWIIDRDREQVIVHRPGDDGEVETTTHERHDEVTSALVEGFTVRLDDLLP